MNANELSRFVSESELESDLAEKRLIESDIVRLTMSIIVIKDINDFLKRVVKELTMNDVFKKIYTHLQNQIQRISFDENKLSTLYQFYRLNVDFQLLYLVSRSKSDRFCISKILQKKVLEYAHDRHAHERVHRTYNLLKRFMFIFKMKKFVNEYVLFCSFCQLLKSSRQLFYEELHSIDLSEESLIKISIDFIVALSKTTNNFNALLIVIDQFFKFVLLIADRENLSILE